MPSRTRRSGAPWWGPLALIGYLVAVGVPALTLMLVVWVSSGAEVVSQPIKQQAVGVVRSCVPGGALYVRLWYSCAVDIARPSPLPPEIQVDPPDLRPDDVGKTVTVEQRVLRSTLSYTTDRPHPYDVVGFVACVALLLAAALGFVRLVQRLQRTE